MSNRFIKHRSTFQYYYRLPTITIYTYVSINLMYLQWNVWCMWRFSQNKYMFRHWKAAQSFLISGSITSISICVNINVLWKYTIFFGLPSIKNLHTWLCRTISTAFKNNRNDNRIALVFISGGEGSRTPVQCKFHINFYIVSLLLLILQTKLFVFPTSKWLHLFLYLIQV